MNARDLLGKVPTIKDSGAEAWQSQALAELLKADAAGKLGHNTHEGFKPLSTEERNKLERIKSSKRGLSSDSLADSAALLALVYIDPKPSDLAGGSKKTAVPKDEPPKK